MKLLQNAVLVALPIITSANLAQAAVSIVSDADSYVDSGTGSNHGSSEDLVVKRSSAGAGSQFTRTSWIHFNTSALTGLATATSASFSIAVKDSSNQAGSGIVTLWGIAQGQDGDLLGTDWAEADIKGNNAPQTPDFTDGLITQQLDTFAFNGTSNNAGDIHTFSSASLLNFLQADTNNEVTFLLTRSVNDQNLAYYSRENSAGAIAPTLSITPVPEPSSTALLGLGGLALILRRTR